MSDTKQNSVDSPVQIVECGAAVPVNEQVLQHGILLVMPTKGQALVKLMLDTKDGVITKYNFEQVEPDGPHIKEVIVRVHPAKKESGLILPKRGLNGSIN